MVFGDLFLADVRAYREASLATTGITPVFPLWQRPTSALAREIITSGIRAAITCVDPAQAPWSIAGRWYDDSLLRDLPPAVDPCGENGEFHTFVTDGPGFAHSLDITFGETIERDGFVFTDLTGAPPTSRRFPDLVFQCFVTAVVPVMSRAPSRQRFSAAASRSAAG